MNRRDLFALRIDDLTVEISCERLFILYNDAADEPARQAFLARAAGELEDAKRVRLKDSYWIASGELERALAPILAACRKRGGSVDYA